MLVELINGSTTRGGMIVSAGVSLQLGAGEALILRGANGSGKTTLLRSLAGLQPLFDGTLTCDPEHIAYSGHADGVKAMLTVSENLRFWASVFGGGGIEKALDAFGLTHLQGRFASTLSAGQLRRLGLAKLMVTGRKVWLLDEPTVSLDAGSVELFGLALKAHLEQGGAAILTSHIDLPVAATTLNLDQFRATGMDIKRSTAFDEALG